jgi:hypothetical protein
MPNTTNYSFPTPADTDLVKNGADAIRDLGDAVDTAMNTALGTKKSGLVLLNTTSFSGVSSQSVSDVFSSTYETYLINVNGVGVANAAVVDLRLRVSGTDATGTDYKWQGLSAINTTISGSFNNTQSFVRIGVIGEQTSIVSALITKPFLADKTGAFGNAADNRTTPNANIQIHAGFHNLATSYTGFTLLFSQSSTGKVSVYGYNQ